MSRRFVLKNQSTLQRLTALTRGKLMAPQLDTIDMLRKFPPMGKPVIHREKVPILHYEKDEKIDKFRERYPNADPPRVDLRLEAGFRSAGYNFVTQQLDLMAKEGLSEEEAFRVVEKRYLEEVDARVVYEAQLEKEQQKRKRQEKQQQQSSSV